jgi:hypothetical protein
MTAAALAFASLAGLAQLAPVAESWLWLPYVTLLRRLDNVFR